MKMRKVSSFVFIALALSLSGCSGDLASPQKLVFAGAPMQAAGNTQVNSYQYMLDVIQKDTGVEIEYLEVTDRATIVEGLVSGKIDFASVDPYGYVLASSLDDSIQTLAAYTKSPGTKPGFKSVAVARKDNDMVTDLSNLSGLTVCFSDPASTAGYLYPAAAIQAAGTKVDVTSSGEVQYVFSGIVPSQPAVNVFEKSCDIGFIPDTQWMGVLPTLENFDRDALEIIWESEHVPGVALVAGSSIESDLQKKLIEIITTKANKTYFAENGICASETDCAFLSPANWGYVPVDPVDYESVREKCISLGIAQCKK